jgi:Spy/CpxP family protein refolding chaperone
MMETDMTDTGLTEQSETPEQSGGNRRRWRLGILAVALFAVGTAAGFAASTAHGMPWWIMGAGGHHKFSAERIAAHADRRVDRMLSRVDATDDQRGKVKAITQAAISDLTAQGVMPWEARAKFIALVRADTIDPAAFEALRAEQIGKADTASKRVVQALTEAAAVLTVEQRRELTERWQERIARQK